MKIAVDAMGGDNPPGPVIGAVDLALESNLDVDFLLTGPRGKCYVEVKSITLVQDGKGLFPDGITARGARHVRELEALANQGHNAAVVFVVQRQDVQYIRPHDRADPRFGRALREAAASGVMVLAFRCSVSLTGIQIGCMIPMNL